MPGKLSGVQNVTVASAASTFIAGTNPRRKAITFFSPTTNRISLAFGAAAVLDGGPTLQPGQVPFRVSVEEVGEIIQQQITGIAAAGPTNLSYIEESDW